MNNNFNSSYKPYSGQSSFGNNKSFSNSTSYNQQFGQSNFKSSFNSSCSCGKHNIGNSFQSSNYQPSQFQRQTSFSLTQKPFGCTCMCGARNFGSQFNRPISVYGNNTGFYFPRTNYSSLNSQFKPRENNTIMFNNTTQPPLVAPNENYQQPTYQEPVYQEPVHQEPVYQEPVHQEPVYQEPEYQEQASNNNQEAIEEFNVNYGYIKSVLDELSASSNSENQRSAVIVDTLGNILSQGYNFIDENGEEYWAEQYAIQGLSEVQHNPSQCAIYLNSPTNEQLAELILSNGILNIFVLTTSSKETKKFKKDKEMKKATSLVENNGGRIEILQLED